MVAIRVSVEVQKYVLFLSITNICFEIFCLPLSYLINEMPKYKKPVSFPIFHKGVKVYHPH